MRLRSRLRTGALACAIILFAAMAGAAAYFFQGFEYDTSGWFPFNGSSVARVASGNASASYNSGLTSVYASGISAAHGGYFARVKSAIANPDPDNDPSKGQCFIDTDGPGPQDSLLCLGPFTRFGLPSGTTSSPLPFPANGYTTQVSIYLDTTYASHHPDCGPVGSIAAPCLPDVPGTVNSACTSDPNGIDCEGTRFDWTLGVNRPNGSFLQDYVFKVGTAPDPSGNFGGCSEGYIINAQYNSYRSGGYPYDPNWEPKCITESGWYTFQQIFKNDGGYLEVDFKILDSTGNLLNTCKDTNGNLDACSWVRHPGHSIEQVGCPRYGWFADEEINDLPIDDTSFVGDCFGATAGQILPTDTTCQAYVDGSVATLGQLAYTVRAGTISSVAPGVFFYYARISALAGDTVNIVESHTGTAPVIPVQKTQVLLYTDTCANIKWESLTVNADGSISGTLPDTGVFIVSVKYSASAIRGNPAPSPSTITYSFGGNSVFDTINLIPK